MGVLSANRSRVGLDHDSIDAAAGEDVFVGLDHGVVAFVEAGLVYVEAVSVLHIELADSDQSAPGPKFVAELGLYLVEGHGQVTIAADVGFDDGGQQLFAGRGEHEVALSPVSQAEHVGAVRLVASRLLPELAGLEL